MKTRSVGLFTGVNIQSENRNRKQKAKKEIEDEDPNAIAEVEKDEYLDYIEGEYGYDPLKIALDDVSIDVEEYSREEDPTLIVPVSGNSDVLEYQPSKYKSGRKYTAKIKADRDEIRIKLGGRPSRGGWDKESIQTEIDRIKEYIQFHWDHLQTDIESFHQELRDTAEGALNRRREEIREQREMLDEIDVPLQKRDDTPNTISVDAPKRRMSVEKPEPSGNYAGEPAPTVPKETYRDILDAIQDIGTGFERSPRLFESHGEEELRDFLLFFLEMNFEGTATGETFNKSGKSDIMLRWKDGTNVFVAECALWDGGQYFAEKIDQLFNYLTWRDSKAAVILFVQRQEIEPVREQIDSGGDSHDCIIELTDQPNESWWQYRGHFPDDPDRELDLAVFAFHIPPS